MTLWADRHGHKAGRAFTLVELLLVLVLLLLLFGAVAFNFSGLLQSNQLEEGAMQIESVMRFARAHAADSGRTVRLVFESSTNSDFAGASLKLTWEPDPIQLPGWFEDLTQLSPQLQDLNDLVQIDEVKLIGFPAGNPRGPSAEKESSDLWLEEELNAPLPSITFNPDGSSDSAEILLSARDAAPDDFRQISIRLQGLTGLARHQLVQFGGEEFPEEEPVAKESTPGGASTAPAKTPAPNNFEPAPRATSQSTN